MSPLQCRKIWFHKRTKGISYQNGPSPQGQFHRQSCNLKNQVEACPGCGTHTRAALFLSFFDFFCKTQRPAKSTIHPQPQKGKCPWTAGSLGAFFEAEGGNKIPAVFEMGWWADGDRTTARLFCLLNWNSMFAQTKRALCAAQPVFWGIEPACLAFARISQVRSAASAAC